MNTHGQNENTYLIPPTNSATHIRRFALTDIHQTKHNIFQSQQDSCDFNSNSQTHILHALQVLNDERQCTCNNAELLWAATKTQRSDS